MKHIDIASFIMSNMIGIRSCSGFPDLKSGSIVVCHYAMGLSFLALILLTGRLYDINKEVGYLQLVSVSLEEPEEPPDGMIMQEDGMTAPERFPTDPLAREHIDNLRTDIHLLILELWSARTTLILSVVFVLVYILSWGWMAYAIKETRTEADVSLKTVLLLAVFAAVDIAASAGFVMVRIIIFVMRDSYFPRDMRRPSLETEHDQLFAITALRLSSLKSSSGSIDIFVSIVVGFLTGLRVYSVVCVISYYNKAKKGAIISYQKDVTGGTDGAGSQSTPTDRHKSDLDDYYPRPLVVNMQNGTARKQNGEIKGLSYIPKIHTLSRERSRLSSVTATSCTEEEDLSELKIQAADMPAHMQRAAVHSASQAVRLYNTEKHIAESIKQDFDTMYNPTWHCIVGRNWGSCVTHSKQCYIRLAYKDLTILLYKST